MEKLLDRKSCTFNIPENDRVIPLEKNIVRPNEAPCFPIANIVHIHSECHSINYRTRPKLVSARQSSRSGTVRILWECQKCSTNELKGNKGCLISLLLDRNCEGDEGLHPTPATQESPKICPLRRVPPRNPQWNKNSSCVMKKGLVMPRVRRSHVPCGWKFHFFTGWT